MSELTEEPDAALVLRARDGDTAAYATLMRRHFDAAFATARRLTTCDEDAEDACQEAFTRVYFRLDQCGDPVRFRGWLLQIVRNHAHNVRRYQALRAALSLDDVAEQVSDPKANDVELVELRDQLHAALAALTPIKRAVVRHHDIDGWTHGQIANALGISVLMSRRHLSDARRILRARLDGAAYALLSGENENE